MELPDYPRAKDIRSVLLARADMFGLAFSLPRSTISKKALGDSSFLQKVAAGGNFTLRSYKRLNDWIDKRHAVLSERELYKRQLTVVKHPPRAGSQRAAGNMRNGHNKRKTKQRRSSGLPK